MEKIFVKMNNLSIWLPVSYQKVPTLFQNMGDVPVSLNKLLKNVIIFGCFLFINFKKCSRLDMMIESENDYQYLHVYVIAC